MLKILGFACLSLMLLIGDVWAGKIMKIDNLEQFRWKNRLLLLFSPSVDFPAYQALNEELAQNAEGVQDRNLLVFRVLEQGPSFMGSQEMSPQSADSLRKRFGVSRGAFAVVLVGKDGGVKLQREGAVTLTDIFGLIDSMPMRQREMQEK